MFTPLQFTFKFLFKSSLSSFFLMLMYMLELSLRVTKPQAMIFFFHAHFLSFLVNKLTPVSFIPIYSNVLNIIHSWCKEDMFVLFTFCVFLYFSGYLPQGTWLNKNSDVSVPVTSTATVFALQRTLLLQKEFSSRLSFPSLTFSPFPYGYMKHNVMAYGFCCPLFKSSFWAKQLLLLTWSFTVAL